MEMVIYRGTSQIGGSCVELRSGGSRILLDIGMPLSLRDCDAPGDEDSAADLRMLGILPNVDGVYRGDEQSVEAVILSHAHHDHMGLAGYVHERIPVYATLGTWALYDSLRVFVPQPVPIASRAVMETGQSMRIGPFTVTAHLVDHSAPDAVAVEVEADGHTLLYSGDVRAHGRKASSLYHLQRKLAGRVDTLVMEGTTIGRLDKPVTTEDDLEWEFVRLLRKQRHMAVVFCSSQNLDRLVTIFRAVRRTGKTMVIDLYTAYTLHNLEDLSMKVPQWDWDEIRVVPWRYQQRLLREAGKEEFIEHTRSKWIGWNEMKTEPRSIVLLARSNRILEGLERECGDEIQNMSIVWSMWWGYWDDDEYIRPLSEKHGVNPVHLHTSGHCNWADIESLVETLCPGRVIPIHTENAEHFARHLPNSVLLEDGQVYELL